MMSNYKMEVTFTREIKEGSRVFFHGEDGVREARVVYLWPDMGGPGGAPGVNLEGGPTSVPHSSHVSGASSFFWTFTGYPESV